MSQPNFFQRRWEWHWRVVDFEKKFEAIRPAPSVRSKTNDLKDLLSFLATLETKLNTNLTTKPTPRGGGGNGDNAHDHYKNRLMMSTVNCGGDKTYLVTLLLDNADDLYDDVEETKEFDTESDALRCFQSMLKLKTMFPQTAHQLFQDYK
jgi:hypothetical protein